jgi:hypothetical protein
MLASAALHGAPADDPEEVAAAYDAAEAAEDAAEAAVPAGEAGRK